MTVDETLKMCEVWKLNAERNAKIANENKTMDIFTEPGTQIVYTGKNGWPSETDIANELLSIGGVYTVEEMQVHNRFSRVKLLEVDAKFFNPVMFRNID